MKNVEKTFGFDLVLRTHSEPMKEKWIANRWRCIAKIFELKFLNFEVINYTRFSFPPKKTMSYAAEKGRVIRETLKSNPPTLVACNK